MPIPPQEQLLSASEAIPLQELEARYGDVSTLGASEMHALTYIVLCMSDGPMSRKDMKKALIEVQGAQPAWGDLASNTAFSYVEKRFVPAGLAVLDKENRSHPTHPGPMSVLVVSPVQSDKALARAGALLDWSLKDQDLAQHGHAQLSLRQLFGESRPTTSKVDGGIARAAAVDMLLKNPGLAEIEVADALGITRPEMNSLFKGLLKEGILEVKNASDWEDRMFKLSGKGFYSNGMTRGELRPETQKLYDAVDILVASGHEEVSAQELFDFILQLDSDLNPSAVRAIITRSLFKPDSPVSHRSFPALESEGAFSTGNKKTKYFINEDYRAGLEGLFDTLQQISDGNADTIAQYEMLAVDLYADPSQVNVLIGKAKAASPQKRPVTDAELLGLVGEFITEEGELTVRGLAGMLKNRGVPMSVGGVAQRVRDLLAADKIESRKGPINNRNAREVTYITGVKE